MLDTCTGSVRCGTVLLRFQLYLPSLCGCKLDMKAERAWAALRNLGFHVLLGYKIPEEGKIQSRNSYRRLGTLAIVHPARE